MISPTHFSVMAATRMKNRNAANSPSSSSYRTTPVMPAHRFDHLIGEQKTLVRNAQEGLNQSLVILERATTKEEQESAGMQVKSLLTRCEELLMKLKVVMYIRSELDYVQRELTRKKKSHASQTQLYIRQQWLENRLEKLVLTRRRVRPGARGQRAMISQDESKDRFYGAGRRTNFAQTNDRFFLTSDRKETLRDDDRNTTSSITIESTSAGRTGITRSTTERDSDEWHSESEANWTTIDAYAKVAPKKVYNSLNHDQEIDFIKERSKISEERESLQDCRTHQQPSKSPQNDLYSFERPRSRSLFGPVSWNLLCLAQYSNFVDDDDKRKSPPEEVVDNPLIDNDLIILWTEIKTLQELVHVASNVMRAGQTLLPLPTRKGLSATFPGKRRVTTAISHSTTFMKQRDVIPSIPEPVNQKTLLSRRVYGGLANSYPKPSSTWYSPSKSGEKHQETTNRDDGVTTSPQTTEEGLSWTKKHYYKRKQLMTAKSAIKRDPCCLTIDHLSDYKDKCVESLLDVLKNSNCDEQRKDAAQALSQLATKDHETAVTSTLKDAMMNDTNNIVRYEAMKSLMKLGVWDAHLYTLVSGILSNGSLELQEDLLSLLLTEDGMKNIVPKLKSDDDMEDSQKQDFICTLRQLVNEGTDNDSISYNAAVILAQSQHSNYQCERRLRLALQNGSSQQKSKALYCLVIHLKCTDEAIIANAIYQSEKLIDWKLRLSAISCLRSIGIEVLLSEEEKIIKFLKKRLAAEPVHVVRVTLGCLVTELGYRPKFETEIIKELENPAEMERAEAVVSLSGLISDSNKVQNALMDTLEFDPSMYIRLLVASMIGKSKSLNSVAMSRLRSKCDGIGLVANHCRSAFSSLLGVTEQASGRNRI